MFHFVIQIVSRQFNLSDIDFDWETLKEQSTRIENSIISNIRVRK